MHWTCLEWCTSCMLLTCVGQNLISLKNCMCFSWDERLRALSDRTNLEWRASEVSLKIFSENWNWIVQRRVFMKKKDLESIFFYFKSPFCWTNYQGNQEPFQIYSNVTSSFPPSSATTLFSLLIFVTFLLRWCLLSFAIQTVPQFKAIGADGTGIAIVIKNPK